jgi:hypothetical protein
MGGWVMLKMERELSYKAQGGLHYIACLLLALVLPLLPLSVWYSVNGLGLLTMTSGNLHTDQVTK